MKRIDKSKTVITVPDASITAPDAWHAPAVVLYGGLYGMEGAWFLNTQQASNLLEKAIFVLPKHFTNRCDDCLSELQAEVKESSISSYSLCGFSRGGVEVYRYKTLRVWKILGLIDPTAPTMAEFQDTALDAFKDKIRCVYWVPNWGADGYKGKVPRFAKHLRDLGVKMLEKATPHQFMPKLFFDTYGTDLLN